MLAHDKRLEGTYSTKTTNVTSIYLDDKRSDGQPIVTTDDSEYTVYREQVYPGALIKGDGNTPNPWSYSVTEDYYPIGTMSWYNWDYSWRVWQEITGSIGGFCPLPTWRDSSDYTRVSVNNLALARFYESAGFGKASLQTDLGELRDTFEMAKRAAMGLARPVRAASTLTRQFFSRWGALKVPANAYLAYIFGLKPLVEDIHEICKIVDSNLPASFPVKGRAHRVINYIVRDDWVSNYTTFVAAEYGANVVVSDEARYTLSRMGILGPSSLAWELLPFSFVADYICNLGQFLYLNEVAYRTGLTLLNGYVSELTVTDRACSFALSEEEWNGSYRRGYATAFGHKVDFRRSTLSCFPTPLAPSLRVSLGSGRLLNLGALLSQRLPALPKTFR
ncbi:maturation protein [ssRNA phage SRR6960551_10]|uniref:Maturation protein n=1 Tax=ssRNA phage SRR6960551_10 TaxID=2786548 RepID=A0A8S5L4Z6_9VIRU|nr:maturation protein [ssRNA phage SRR6960551_10]DAD52619.1 TPA_asm: maturation protein [ssRNA phage SRR6960551_10]